MAFDFISTRGYDAGVSAPRAVIQGLAPDGGLFVPTEFPPLTIDLATLPTVPYRDLAKQLLTSWLPGYTSEAIETVVSCGYGEGVFDHPELTPVRSFGSHHFIELFHGPTLAFKDLALSLLPHLLVEGRHLLGVTDTAVILTATSGDTGSAAITGFADVPETRIIVFYPEGGVSPIQKKQMVCQPGSNVSVCAVKGNFDDAQTAVKGIFADADINRYLAEHHCAFSTANSMNIGRLVPQMVYYFYAYGQLIDRGIISAGDKVNIVVPSGNFGNILASWYASQAGLPVHKFICASNKNCALPDFFATGTYNADREFFKTSSPSMDILVSSNLERLLFHLSGNDSDLVSRLMNELKGTRRYDAPSQLKDALRESFVAGFANDLECSLEIGDYYRDNGYILDPHTAVASRVLKSYQAETKDDTPALIAATASPFKFTRTVFESIFGAPGDQTDFELIHALSRQTGTTPPHRFEKIEDWTPLHNDVCDPDQAGNYVRERLAGEH